MNTLKILLIGDIVGQGGRRAVTRLSPELRREFNCAFVIANGENAAGGAGLTKGCVDELHNAGVDVITSGDHIWDRSEFVNDISRYSNVLRPANFDHRQPGAGYGVFPVGGTHIGVINLIGRVFMARSGNCPFATVDRILDEIADKAPHIIVDFHAEATSEKIAMGRYLDGRVSAVVGTHTHVQTADAQLFPKGTAYLTDLGMVGARESVLGRDIGAVVHRFRTGLPARFDVVNDGVVLHGALLELDSETGRACRLERIVRET